MQYISLNNLKTEVHFPAHFSNLIYGYLYAKLLSLVKIVPAKWWRTAIFHHPFAERWPAHISQKPSKSYLEVEGNEVVNIV